MDVTSTLQGETVRMSLDMDALPHLMSVLTDLYSDPEMAVLREYCTNALDAHIEAGVSLPIEVTLPTSLSPFLKIRDFGSGLDVDDIRSIYSQYGASTKRDTNDLVGSLGLGCKSALTYTDQFTLQGIKNGICTQVSISRDEDGAGSMTVLPSYETEDASGVEITIPAKARNDFEEKAQFLFQFWQDGSVLVNGKAPARIEGIEFADDIQIVSGDVLNESVVVMGNVPYPVDALDGGNYRVIAYVPIGAVAFTPSREALQMTVKTKAVVEEIGKRVNQGKEAAVARLLEAAQSKPQALRIALEAARLFNYKGDLTFNGESIPSEMIAPLKDGEDPEQRYASRIPFLVVRSENSRRRRSRSVSEETALPISVALNHVFFTGYTNKMISPTIRQKLEQFWNTHSHEGVNVENFVFLNELQHSEWIDPARVFDYATTVAAQKLPRNGTRLDGKPAGAYKIGTAYGETIMAEDIDTSEPIYYTTWDSYSSKLLLREHPKATIIFLANNRVGKFQRMFPQAKAVEEAAREIAEQWFATLSADQMLWLTMGDYAKGAYSKLDAALVDDPAIKTAIAVAKQRYPKLESTYTQYARLATPPTELKWVDPAEAYPLLSTGLSSIRYGSGTKEHAVTISHLYMYLNAAYAAAKEATV
jgi:hypothetical protein